MNSTRPWQMQAVVGNHAACGREMDKYRVTLTEIEGRRDAATQALQGFLKGLGYV